MFGKIKERLTGGASRLTGKTDLLEAIAAACVLVAAADGEIEDEEVAATMAALTTHATLTAAFKTSEIERVTDGMFRRAGQGRAGRLGLKREIEQAKARSSTEDLEMLLVIAVDVSMSDGEMEPAERVVLGQIADIVGLPLARYLDA
ncbi:TerB family tellurite resistance protein [Tistrella bauzanensis]|uniref:TerB family tellurite resistance protein n=1 Tax=Tistrella TaxID=171436 RepID=UPI0031F6DD52